MYLTSSRGAFVAAGVSVIVYIVLTPRRWAALAALLVAGIAGAVAIAALVHKKALVNGAMDTTLGVHQGHRAAILIGVACVVTALLWLGLAELGRRLPTPPRVVGVAIAIAVVGLVLVAIVASHPVAKFDQFKNNAAVAGSHATGTTNHLLGTSGTVTTIAGVHLKLRRYERR